MRIGFPLNVFAFHVGIQFLFSLFPIDLLTYGRVAFGGPPFLGTCCTVPGVGFNYLIDLNRMLEHELHTVNNLC